MLEGVVEEEVGLWSANSDSPQGLTLLGKQRLITQTYRHILNKVFTSINVHVKTILVKPIDIFKNKVFTSINVHVKTILV